MPVVLDAGIGAFAKFVGFIPKGAISAFVRRQKRGAPTVYEEATLDEVEEI